MFLPYFQGFLTSDGTLSVIGSATKAVIGCSKYHTSEDAAGDISIGGTFLAGAKRGGAINAELKRLMLNHAFKTCERGDINPANIRPQKATAKISAMFDHDAVIRISRAPGL